jgi:hypothetical protein
VHRPCDDVLGPLRRSRIIWLYRIFIQANSISPPAASPPNRQRWLEPVWCELPINGGTKPMYGYLNASLTPVYRLYLFDALVISFPSGGAPVESAHLEASEGT